jgi:hypothetical protein
LTTVVSVRGRKPAELLADPAFVYVGRAATRAGWKASIWGNPFNRFVLRHFSDTKQQQAVDAAAMFARWLDGELRMHLVLRDNPGLSRMTPAGAVEARLAIIRGLPELRGKTLGCWCGTWKPGEADIGCHAVVLAKLANGPLGDPKGGGDGA